MNRLRILQIEILFLALEMKRFIIETRIIWTTDKKLGYKLQISCFI